MSIALPNIFQYLPFLEGWRRRIKIWYWYELENNPVRKGQCNIVLKLKPPDDGFIFIAGFFTQVSSKYCNIAAIQRILGTTEVLFSACPLFLYSDGDLTWQSWSLYLTRYDTTNNVYSMKFVPPFPVPICHEIDIVACLGYPVNGIVKTTIPYPPTREWIPVEDEEAWVNYVGIEQIEVFDIEKFLKSLAKLDYRIRKYLLELEAGVTSLT